MVKRENLSFHKCETNSPGTSSETRSMESQHWKTFVKEAVLLCFGLITIVKVADFYVYH